MECKPFDIKVVLVTPGAVRSNIANNALPEFTMPEESFYKPFMRNIIARINTSQTGDSYPTEKFAEQVVNTTLTPKLPLSFMSGGRTLIYKIFAWLPRSWVLSLVWWKFSQPPKDN